MTDSVSLADLTARAEVLAAELTAAVNAIRAAASASKAQPDPVAVRPSLLTVEQAAEALGLSRSAVYTLISSGQLRSVRIGSRRRVPIRAVDAFVTALTGVA
jgi:excisionase family DNA binding protein